MSKIARDMSCDRRTAKRYYEGDFPNGKRDKPSYLDVYYDTIKELLGPDSIQVFYFKSSLWRYLMREKILDCPQSTFRGYILSLIHIFPASSYIHIQCNPSLKAAVSVSKVITAPG